MIIIGFCNLKGGVGKTTACQNIAAALSKMGKKVAVVDMDPQSNLSAGFGVAPSPTDPQVFDLLSGEATWDEILCNKEGIDIIPSSLNLVMAELNQTGPLSSDSVLRDALSKIDTDRYDYVLLDSPPQLGIFTRNVLAACSKLIVPLDGGFYSLFGLRLLNSSLPVFRERINPDLDITGILMTNYNPRLYISRKVFEEVRKSFGEVLFENYIRQNISLVEATSMGMSIFKYAPKSRGAEGYNKVTEELLRKLEGIEINSEHDPAPEATSDITEPEREELEEIHIDEVKYSNPDDKPDPQIIDDIKPAESYTPSVTGDYEEGIKQDIIEMLPESAKAMWTQMLGPVSDITRDQLDAKILRDDFKNCDKDRYTFYILNDEADSLWPIVNADQIVEPLRCVVKWDECGPVEVYM